LATPKPRAASGPLPIRGNGAFDFFDGAGFAGVDDTGAFAEAAEVVEASGVVGVDASAGSLVGAVSGEADGEVDCGFSGTDMSSASAGRSKDKEMSR
jgi:hypothetical protein